MRWRLDATLGWIGARGVIPAVAVAAVSLLGASACHDSQRRDLGREALSRPVAVVNTEPITLDEFQTSYQLRISRWDRFLRIDPEKERALKTILLEQIIAGKLLDQEARRKGIEVSQDLLALKLNELVSPLDQGYIEQAAEQVHTTLAEWTRSYHRRLVHEKLVAQEVVDRIRITDRDIRRYYDAHREEFRLPEKARVRHLAVGSRKAYDRIRRRLREDADFVELIRQYSITPDRLLDGDLGFVERGVLPPEFDRVIFSMTQVGRINKLRRPVQTQMGYHIFRLEGRREARLLPLSEAAPIIRKKLRREHQAEAYGIWLKRLRERATISIDEEMLLAEMG